MGFFLLFSQMFVNNEAKPYMIHIRIENPADDYEQNPKC